MLDEICVKLGWAPRARWANKSNDDLAAEAKRYKSRNEFNLKSSTAYTEAKRRGIFEEICKHMAPIKKWKDATDAEIAQKAKKYKLRSVFIFHNQGAYNEAKRRGIYEEICKHMPEAQKPWTIKELAKEAKKYKFRGEFQQKNPGAYRGALKRKCMDKICAHMMPARISWVNASDEELLLEAQKYKTRSEFFKGSSTANKEARNRGIYEKVCQHMIVKSHRGDAWNRESNEALAAEAKKYRTQNAFKRSNPIAFKEATKRNILQDVLTNVGKVFWNRKSDEDLANEAKKYTKRIHFRKRSNAACLEASRRHILDDICKHMEKRNRYEDLTNKELVQKVKESKFTRKELLKKDRMLYRECVKRKILDLAVVSLKPWALKIQQQKVIMTKANPEGTPS